MTPSPDKLEIPEAAVEALSWRCFHCDEVFTDEHSARLHFGTDEMRTPACQIKGSEHGLLEALREAENDAANAQHALLIESTDAAKAYYSQNSRHQRQMRAVEQVGYDRGIADAKTHPETLGLSPLPHIPDRGYAEVDWRTAAELVDRIRALAPPAPTDNGERVASWNDGQATLQTAYDLRDALNGWPGPYNLVDAQGFANMVHRCAFGVRTERYSATLKASSPADNGEKLKGKFLELHRRLLAARKDHMFVVSGGDFREFEEAFLDAAIILDKASRPALSATPSPIEDVAGPSEVEIEAAQDGGDPPLAQHHIENMLAAVNGDPAKRQGHHHELGKHECLVIDKYAARQILTELLAARRVRPSPVDEDEATAKRLADASDYSIQLQRIIEAICHDTPLREDSKTLHHYRMAEKFKAELDGTRNNLRHWREECGKLHAREETLRSLLTYIREHDGNAPGDNPALCQQIDAALQSQRKG